MKRRREIKKLKIFMGKEAKESMREPMNGMRKEGKEDMSMTELRIPIRRKEIDGLKESMI